MKHSAARARSEADACMAGGAARKQLSTTSCPNLMVLARRTKGKKKKFPKRTGFQRPDSVLLNFLHSRRNQTRGTYNNKHSEYYTQLFPVSGIAIWSRSRVVDHAAFWSRFVFSLISVPPSLPLQCSTSATCPLNQLCPSSLPSLLLPSLLVPSRLKTPQPPLFACPTAFST
jgi:hypothetical protein